MIQEMNHVSVGVEDLEKSVKFYTEVMGMEIDYRAHHKGLRQVRLSVLIMQF